MVQSPPNRMASVAGPYPSPDRLSVAFRALRDLSDEQLGRVVWKRLLGQRDRMLPPLGRDESPSDLLIAIVEQYPDSDVTKKLQLLAAGLLREVTGSHNQSPATIGELCYFAAGTESAAAAESLVRLIESDSVTREALPNGQSLHVFALRCLLGLLHSVASEFRNERLQILLESLLADQSTQTFALTALAALWPERWKEFSLRVPGANLELVRAGLEIAGFDPNSIRP